MLTTRALRHGLVAGLAFVGGCDGAATATRCNADDDCAVDERCLGGVCAEARGEGGFDACPTTNDGRCDEPASCAAGTDAVDCARCTVDDDCPPSDVCAADGACVPGCRDGFALFHPDDDNDGVTAGEVVVCTSGGVVSGDAARPARRPLPLRAPTGVAADAAAAQAIDGTTSTTSRGNVDWLVARCEPALVDDVPLAVRVVMRSSTPATVKVKTEEGASGSIDVTVDGDVDRVSGGPDLPIFRVVDAARFCERGRVRLQIPEGAAVEIDGVELSFFAGDDCDDADATRSIGAEGFADVDGDGWGGAPFGSTCLSQQEYAALLFDGGDCADDEPLAHPGAAAQSSPVDDVIGFDWDCDGVVEPEPLSDLDCPAVLPCNAASHPVTGACGEPMSLTTSCADDGSGGCAAATTTTPQTCR